jgi:hypothetical protein
MRATETFQACHDECVRCGADAGSGTVLVLRYPESDASMAENLECLLYHYVFGRRSDARSLA